MTKFKKPKPGQSLADLNPDLAREWHPTKNGDLTPYDVSAGTTSKVWWKCPKGGDHEWEASIGDRHRRGIGCAICSNYKVVESNCLATTNPELAQEWHPTKNGNLTPKDVHAGSSKTIWWKCPNGDDHEWKAKVYSRNHGKGCPICDGKKVVPSTCLATLNPELAGEWHPTKNGNLTPFDVGINSKQKLWWKCPKGGDHEWQAVVNARSNGLGCPICVNQKAVISNCLATLNPELAMEWHPTKNGDLTPYDVVPGSGRIVWWKCPKGQDHEWRSEIKRRSSGRGCPICIGRKVVNSNSFLTLHPELAKELHPTKNKGLNPNKYRPFSNKRVWWQCSQYPQHEWLTSFNMRVQGTGCPYCRAPHSDPELRLYCELKTIFPNIKSRQKVSGKEVDIYITELNFGIEYDGWFWHKDKSEADARKGRELTAETGMFLLRLREEGLDKITHTDIALSNRRLDLQDVKKVCQFMLDCSLLDVSQYQSQLKSYLDTNVWLAEESFRDIKSERSGVIYEKSLEYLYPELASMWSYEKNYPLLPSQFLPNSHAEVWWDSKTGKIWKSQIAYQVRRAKKRSEQVAKNLSLF